jgi:hypothetical protein
MSKCDVAYASEGDKSQNVELSEASEGDPSSAGGLRHHVDAVNLRENCLAKKKATNMQIHWEIIIFEKYNVR